MSVTDYTDRFIANLLAGGLVTCLTMSVVGYFNWFANGIGGLTPEVVQLCLVVLLASVTLFVLPWLWCVCARSRRTLFAETWPRAGAWQGRATGLVLGLAAAVSIIAQLR
ncbi:hypothetical protein [Paraburkholderia tuberum]|uniref:Uncharacterized protein n=1 Tax=Paraburkholderia tuberum TaxID=157910 RepID=A0A1H1JZS2_9BURK|nr:hypothetical protein [Paraburkholderia tuberum]SDR55571.1 hypothetical protein SAMN05445850_6109 [Paraburkholderia tuberum]